MRTRRTPLPTDRVETQANGSLPVSPPTRLFAPGELDLDALAEAIRLLLESDGTPRTGRSAHLLSRRPGVTHVVGANQAL